VRYGYSAEPGLLTMDKAFTPTLPMLFEQSGGASLHERQGISGTVSILMRTRNRPLMFPRALRSVIEQGFRDWHLCVVNDGGDPAAIERTLAEHAGAMAGRITLIHHAESQGMEAASNRALEAADGEFVVTHDDDDTWHPDFLGRTVGFLSASANAGYVGVVTGSRIVWERIVGEGIVEDEQEPFPSHGTNIELRRVLGGNSFPPISLLLRRSAVLRVGAFNADLPVLGDWEFNLRVMALGDFGFIDEPLAYYHQRREPCASGYGNTVIAGTMDHQRYDVLLRNSIIRVALRDNPATIGVLQPMLHALQEQTAAVRDMNKSINEVRTRLDRIEEHLSEIHVVARWQSRMLSPIQHAWMSLMPVRRAIARMTGRTL
jgi:glycosyltransferase involved in cell wall biosynthesis